MKKELLAFAMSALGIGALSADAATVYFLNDGDWESVCAYAWTDGTAGDPAWPGAELTSTVTVDGKEYYNVDVETAKVIFNNNNKGKQTKDLTVADGAVFSVTANNSGDGTAYPIGTIKDGVFTAAGEVEITYAKIYIPVSDYQAENCNIYSWEPSLFGGWPGKAMTKEKVENLSNGNATDYWTVEVDENDIKDQTIGGWKLNGGAGESTEIKNGTIFQNGYVYHLDGTSHALGEHGDEPIGYTNVYIASKQVDNFGLGPNSKMTTEDGEVYTYTVTNASPDFEFKVVVGNSWLGNGSQNMEDGTYTISEDKDPNMTLNKGGEEVTFTVKILGDNKIELTIAGQTPVEEGEFAPIYLVSSKIGNVAIEENRLTTEDGVVYTITKQDFSGDLPFHFIGKDNHQHKFSNGQQNMKNGEYELPVVGANAAHGEMTLDNGGNVTFTFTLAEDHSSATLKIEGQEEVVDEFPRMYLVGERTEWLATEPYRMKTTDGIEYTLEVEDMSTKEFRFTGETWNVRTFGGAGAKLGNETVELTASEHNMTLLKGGHVKFTLTQEDNFSKVTLKIEGQDINGDEPLPTIKEMYLIGQATNTWSVADAIKMESEDGVTYTLTTNLPAKSEFKFFGGAWGSRELTTIAENHLALPNGTFDLVNGPFEDGINSNMALKTGGNVTLSLVITNDDFSTAKLTISGQEESVDPIDPEEPEIIDLYVIGDATPGLWTTQEDYKLSTEDGKTYTITCKLEGAQGFKIYPGNWEDKLHNYGGGEKATDLENEEYDVFSDGANMTLKYGGENVTLTLVLADDYNSGKLTISGQDENIEVEKVVTYHLHGQWDGLSDDDWKTIDLEKQADNTWTAEYTPTVSGGKFGVKKCENGTQVDWYKEAHSFDINNQTKVLSSTGADNCTHAYAENVPCKFTFNPDTLELTVVGDTTTGISTIDADGAEAIYFNLQGIQVVKPEAGLYIVVRNGKTVKEVVK